MLTPRQLYAAAALQGMLAKGADLTSAGLASMAFVYADEMVKWERNSRPEKFTEQEQHYKEGAGNVVYY